jgi:glycine cleavage system transcriptional repressor
VRHLAISAVGRDRPGIVAAVSRVLLDDGLNIEDSQMTILRGHFAMMLVVADPAGADLERLRRELGGVAAQLGLAAVSVSEVEELDRAGPEPSHMVTVYGVDHPGIVHATAAALAERAVDITDLNTRLVEEEGEQPLYALLMEVELPAGVDETELRAALEAVGGQQGVEVTLRPLEQDVL